MSNSLRIVCTECREACWIGQHPYGMPEKAYIYTTRDDASKQARFYMKHKGHLLVFMDQDLFERFDGWECETAEFEEPD